MRKKTRNSFTKTRISFASIFIAFFAIILLSSIISIFLFDYEEGTNAKTKYNCDVKNIRLTTDIEIYNNDEYVRRVKGRLQVITDPLKLYDANSNSLGYAGDDYGIIVQDSHLIKLDKNFYFMNGKFKLLGDEYELFDDEENYIGKCEFNFLNTKGVIRNADDEVIANYKSNIFFRDYDVIIYDNCEFDDDFILLVCASYYSDQKFDSANDK